MARAETIQGILKPDGTIELQERPALPPGPVRVTLETQSVRERDPWETLQRIWDERKSLGLQPRSAEEIDAEIEAMRDEWEQRQREVDLARRGAKESPAE